VLQELEEYRGGQDNVVSKTKKVKLVKPKRDQFRPLKQQHDFHLVMLQDFIVAIIFRGHHFSGYLGNA
jgi:hypothetical protein